MYIYWELELLKNLGYDLEFENLVTKNKIDNEIQYITNLVNKNIILESLISFKRAGANAIISYYADRLDKILY